ncbi:MAG: hypothetical protein J5727_09500 [Kiritimatiellae bacterium]|nr:hypothetical protein [Kiritimatiellia bacterium]
MLHLETIAPATLDLLRRLQSLPMLAETMPMPRMLIPFDWEDAKERIRAAVRGIAVGKNMS